MIILLVENNYIAANYFSINKNHQDRQIVREPEGE